MNTLNKNAISVLAAVDFALYVVLYRSLHISLTSNLLVYNNIFYVCVVGLALYLLIKEPFVLKFTIAEHIIFSLLIIIPFVLIAVIASWSNKDVVIYGSSASILFLLINVFRKSICIRCQHDDFNAKHSIIVATISEIIGLVAYLFTPSSLRYNILTSSVFIYLIGILPLSLILSLLIYRIFHKSKKRP